MRSRALLLVLAASMGLAPSRAWAVEGIAPTTARMGRWHFSYDGTPDLALTVLFTRTTAGDETRHLVETGGARYAFLSRQDPTGADSTESVESIGLSETLSRRLLLKGFEKVEGCEGIKAPDACLLFVGVKGRVGVAMSRLSGDQGPRLREKLRGVMSEPMQKELLGLSSLFARSIEFTAYSGDFLGVLWPGSFVVKNTLGVRRPGCAFDAAFGYPCSEAERGREAFRFAR